jgi:hypothetical protein
MTEDQQQQKLSALLRLKRYEQPPPGYFDKLLQDVHRRQRADLLRRPAWKLLLERVQTFFGEHSMGYGAYAGVATAVVVVGLALFGSSFSDKPAVKAGGAPGFVAHTKPVNLRSDRPTTETILALDGTRVAMANLPEIDSSVANARLFPSRISRGIVPGRKPRYVIDAQPVSYEATQVSF